MNSKLQEKNVKSFLLGIMEEVKQELKEDAEKNVLNQCAQKYQS